MPSKRIMQLKFIANIFNLSLKQIEDTLGFEALTMIFRRVGEDIAENIVNRMQGKYNSVEEFAKMLVEDVIDPIIGEKQGIAIVEGNKVTITLKACPYKRAAGFPIKDMSWFCDYTEGLLHNAFDLAFPGVVELETLQTVARDECKECKFVVSHS